MWEKPLQLIKDEDFVFENTQVKIVARRNSPEIELSGLHVGPFEEGKEYEVRFWVAHELERAGIASLREVEPLTTIKMIKMHWKERVQSAKQISSLFEYFYPRLRRYLAKMKEQAVKNPETIKEYDKVMQLSQDLINCRLKKIISLASVPTQTDQTLRNLTKEERALYDSLSNSIRNWRTTILEVGSEL